MYSGKTLALVAVAVSIVAVLTIYLTPLKWVNLIEPRINDIDAKVFHEDFLRNPDKYVFIDVRSESVYRAAHAKGSINQPIGTLYDGHKLLPRSGKTIVLICSSGRLAGVAYGYLEHQGFQNLARIEGGVQAWVLQGLPLEGLNISAPVPTVD